MRVLLAIGLIYAIGFFLSCIFFCWRDGARTLRDMTEILVIAIFWPIAWILFITSSPEAPYATPLHYLVSRPWAREDWNNGLGEHIWLDEIKAALRSGADVNARCQSGTTPLNWLFTLDDDWNWAITKGAASTLDTPYAKAARLLLSHGADIDAPDPNGRTTLHNLASTWNHEFPDNYGVELFLFLGADRTAKDNDGKTPADLAGGKTKDMIMNFGPHVLQEYRDQEHAKQMIREKVHVFEFVYVHLSNESIQKAVDLLKRDGDFHARIEHDKTKYFHGSGVVIEPIDNRSIKT